MKYQFDETDPMLLEEESICLAVPATARFKFIESVKANHGSLDRKLKPVSVSYLKHQQSMLPQLSAGSFSHPVPRQESPQPSSSEKETPQQLNFKKLEKISSMGARFLLVPQTISSRTVNIRKCDQYLVQRYPSSACSSPTSNLSASADPSTDSSPVARSEVDSSSSWIEEHSVVRDEPHQGLFQIEISSEESRSYICSIESLQLSPGFRVMKSIGEEQPIDTVIDYLHLLESNPTYQQCRQIKYCTQSKKNA